MLLLRLLEKLKVTLIMVFDGKIKSRWTRRVGPLIQYRAIGHGPIVPHPRLNPVGICRWAPKGCAEKPVKVENQLL